MRGNRSAAIALTIAAVAIMGAGCQRGSDTAMNRTAVELAPVDNTAEVCASYQQLLLNLGNEMEEATPDPATQSKRQHDEAERRRAFKESLRQFEDNVRALETAFIGNVTELANRATDATVAAQLRAMNDLNILETNRQHGQTQDQLERANPEVFGAAERAGNALESRCGKLGMTVLPTP